MPPGAVEYFSGVFAADRVAVGDRDDSGDQAYRAVVAQSPHDGAEAGAGTGGTGEYVNHGRDCIDGTGHWQQPKSR
ncbi:hypothetical protein ABZ540_35820 [Nocardia xishanensis]|uniref:hypothetical protein n=1 Tax=Nocardia xishanensis TaxID=238964 RepID=UPI0033C3029E